MVCFRLKKTLRLPPLGATPKVNIKKEVELREKAVDVLIKLKTAIYRSNSAIQEDVFKLSELKSELVLWNEVNCNDGNVLEVDRLFGKKTSIEKVACLQFSEIDERRKKIQNKIEEIQEKLDIHNFQTSIDVLDNINDVLTS